MSEVFNLISDIKEQVLFLQELGVDALTLAPALENKAAKTSVVSDKFKVDSPAPDTSVVSVAQRAKRSAGSRLTELPSLGKRDAVGRDGVLQSAIQTPEPAVLHKETARVEVEQPSAVLSIINETTDTVEGIRAEIGDCTRCALSKLGRKQIVHTTGNFQADLMFIGEAPGADEDEQGFPFVGRAGQLLTKIIEGIGIRREDVCIGNINRCRPPENRKPEPDETATCRPFILREIAVVKPKVIVVLGATAAHNLLQVKTPITKLRGHFHDYFGVKVMPTFHPAYLLRDPHKKREVWEDMKLVRDHLNSYHP